MIIGANATLHIHNLNDNPVAIIPFGNARIQTGYIRIINPIDLSEIENTIKNIQNVAVKQEIFIPLQKLIEAKKQRLDSSFLKLKPVKFRPKRLDMIDTVWKHIGGSPDAEDLRIIERSLNQLTTENNKQILINNAIEQRLNNITEIINRKKNVPATT